MTDGATAAGRGLSGCAAFPAADAGAGVTMPRVTAPRMAAKRAPTRTRNRLALLLDRGKGDAPADMCTLPRRPSLTVRTIHSRRIRVAGVHEMVTHRAPGPRG